MNKETNKEHPNLQYFVFRFVEKNFERREIDQESFLAFNKLLRMISRDMSKNTTKH